MPRDYPYNFLRFRLPRFARHRSLGFKKGELKWFKFSNTRLKTSSMIGTSVAAFAAHKDEVTAGYKTK